MKNFHVREDDLHEQLTEQRSQLAKSLLVLAKQQPVKNVSKYRICYTHAKRPNSSVRILKIVITPPPPKPFKKEDFD